MIKVLWFLKRAEHLTLAEFRDWWLNTHCHMITDLQKPYLKRYVIDFRWDEDTLPGKPGGESDWDGVAEQWFETAEDFAAVYGTSTPSPSRGDTMKHVSRFERLVVHEHEIPVRTDA